VTDALLATGRPVLFTNEVHPKPFQVFPTYPLGPLIRVVRGRDLVPAPAVLLSANLALSDRMVIEPAPPERGSWGASLHEDYARPYLTLKDVFTRMQDRERFVACWIRVRALAPWRLEGSDS
jgi:nicotinamidase-related amidase